MKVLLLPGPTYNIEAVRPDIAQLRKLKFIRRLGVSGSERTVQYLPCTALGVSFGIDT